jgi:muconolactone delta-isomerase
MEYLVTMTTHVPDGTPEQVVDDVRAREAAHSLDLATEGRLLRLWRPPLQPGEWRSLGLFAAGDAGQLQQTLASMPLKIWRTDQVTPLAPHPGDPGPGPGTRPVQSGAEFLATFVVAIPDGASRQAVEDAEAGDVASARELAGQGHLERLWAVPGQGHVLALYRAGDSAEMEAIVKSFPVHSWTMTEITPLTPHPSDPATMST